MKNTSNFRKIILCLIFVFIFSITNATVLVNTSVDKEELSSNEVGFLVINLYNNGSEITDYPIRIETTDNLVLTENDRSSLVHYVDILKEGVGREVKIKFKAINTEKETGQLFVYYGDDLKFVSGTFIKTKELPVVIKTNAQKTLKEDGEKIVIDFEMHNYSQKPIYNIAVEAIVPKNFIIESEQLITPVLMDGNYIGRNISIRPPLGINGEQKIILAYGYFDENKAHYFEKTFTFEFAKSNNTLLAGIGIIVLIIAIFIYIGKSKEPKQNIKGTKEKAEEEN